MRFLRAQTLVAMLAFAAFASALGPSADTAEAKLAEIKALKAPAFDRTKAEDAAYQAEYRKSLDGFAAERGKLILEFVDAFPEHADAPTLLGSYWANLKGFAYPVPKERIDSSIRTIEGFLAKNKRTEFVPLGKYYIATYRQLGAIDDTPRLIAYADEFIKAYPTDPKGINLLRTAAEASKDDKQKIAIYEKIVAQYPDNKFAGMFKGTVKRLQAVGKPFDLSFTDAISGKKVDSASLKGKVVLVDFWATWCGPCIAKMPELLKLHADYKAKGFEIVGISLDVPESEGGLKALKDYVAKNNVGWPHYYQGKGWDGEFSTAWGIMAIPTAFLVDKKGILRSVDAGKDLEKEVQALLAE